MAYYRRTPSEQKAYIRSKNDEKKLDMLKMLNQSEATKNKSRAQFSSSCLQKNFSPFLINKQIVEKNNIISQFIYLGNLNPIQHLLTPIQCRKLKQATLTLIPDAVKLQIVCVPGKPIILIEYYKLVKNVVSKKYLINVVNIMVANRLINSKIDSDYIMEIYKKVFPQVNIEHLQIGKFAYIGRKHEQLEGLPEDSDDLIIQNKSYRLFYSTIQNSINFVLLKNQFRAFEFSSQFIEQAQEQNQVLYEIFLKFKKQIFIQEQDTHDFLIEQIDSDEERNFQKFKDVDKAKKIKQILCQVQQRVERSLKVYELNLKDQKERIQGLKDEEFQEKEPDQKAVLNHKIKILTQKFQSKRIALNNFIQIKSSIQKSVRSLRKNKQKHPLVGKNLMRKLIISQKQLQSCLPIIINKKQIFSYLNKNNILILQGSTGSGKSTQLPQFMLQYFKILQQSKSKPILVTQPRKLAARTLAERVSTQLQQKVHTFVDYQTNANQKINPLAKIIFKFDKLVLDQLQVDQNLQNYCCLIIDQAHERTISIDVILAKVKAIMEKRKDFKVIITSATMNTQLFQKYFQSQSIKIQSSLHHVDQIFYPLPQSTTILQKIDKVFREVIMDRQMNQIQPIYRGHILIFTSGYEQAYQLSAYFSKKLDLSKFKVLSLHARSTCLQQKEVFAQSNRIKIIFATNIAETSITVEGVKVVIDPGFDKEVVFSSKSKISSVQLRLISLSAAKQRSGRAGRTCSGYCFRLYQKKVKQEMALNKEPQIKKMSLNNLILKLKCLKIQSINKFPFINQPDKEALTDSIRNMKILGCLEKDQKLTQIGNILSKIQMDPFLSRSIIQALCFKQFIKTNQKPQQFFKNNKQFQIFIQKDIVLSVAKILSMLIDGASLFYKKQNQSDNSLNKKVIKLFGNLQENGDFFMLQRLFSQFLNLSKNHSDAQLRQWLNDYNLDLNALILAKQTYKQIIMILNGIQKQKINFKLIQIPKIEKPTYEEIVLSCLCLSLIPNLCLFSGNSTIGYTLLSEQKSIKLSGTSFFSLENISPKWIISYGFYYGQKNQLFSRFSQKIQFKFLKISLPQKAFQHFHLEQIQKANPFYNCIKIKLPSLVLTQLYQSYEKRSNVIDFNFLQDFTIIFRLQQFRIQAYHLIKKQQSFLEYKFYSFVEILKKKYNIKFKHEYLGIIQVQLADGVQVHQINLKSTKYIIKIFTKQPSERKLIIQECEETGEMFQYHDKIVIKFQNSADKNDAMAILKKILPQSVFYQSVSEQIIDTRLKIPKMRLRLQFSIGISMVKGHIFMNYKEGYIGNVQEYTQQMFKYLLECQVNMIRNQQEHQFRFANISISKSGTGINYYSDEENIDQFELRQMLKIWKTLQKIQVTINIYQIQKANRLAKDQGLA